MDEQKLEEIKNQIIKQIKNKNVVIFVPNRCYKTTLSKKIIQINKILVH